MAKSKYETLLDKTGASYSLMKWADDQGGGKHGTAESNLWALARLAAAALHYFLSHLVRLKIDRQDEEFNAAEAQDALEGMGDQPAGADDMKRAILTFLGTQQLEHDDTGRNDFAEPEPDDEMEDVAPAAISSALHEAGRTLTSEVTALWAPRERVIAFRWAESKAAGGDAPPPEVVSRRYMEDLDLDTTEGLGELLGWLGIPGVDVEAEDGWDEETTKAVRDWAMAAHLVDRGGDPERQIDIQAPEIVLPEPELFAKIKAYLHQRPAERGKVIEAFRDDDYGVVLALDALHAAKEISYHEVSDNYRADQAELIESPEVLGLTARQVAERRVVALEEEPDADAETDVAEGDEEEAEEAAAAEPEPTDDDAPYEDDDDADPVSLGRAAYTAGKNEDANPFDPEEEADEFLSWQNGWTAARDDAEEEQ